MWRKGGLARNAHELEALRTRARRRGRGSNRFDVLALDGLVPVKRNFVVLGPADRAALPRAAHLAKRAQLPLNDRFSKTSSGLILRNFSMFLMDVGIFASIELLRNSDQNS